MCSNLILVESFPVKFLKLSSKILNHHNNPYEINKTILNHINLNMHESKLTIKNRTKRSRLNLNQNKADLSQIPSELSVSKKPDDKRQVENQAQQSYSNFDKDSMVNIISSRRRRNIDDKIRNHLNLIKTTSTRTNHNDNIKNNVESIRGSTRSLTNRINPYQNINHVNNSNNQNRNEKINLVNSKDDTLKFQKSDHQNDDKLSRPELQPFQVLQTTANKIKAILQDTSSNLAIDPSSVTFHRNFIRQILRDTYLNKATLDAMGAQKSNFVNSLTDTITNSRMADLLQFPA